MKGIAVSVDNLSKIYKLYTYPSDRLKETFHLFKKKYHKNFYALKNISFDIEKGKTIGVIGRNGAGKSTLLKILTGVLTPSTGNYSVKGKVSSLLELGSGFNQDLTGLENIYFNGSIYGFSRQEIDAKMDDIIAFADIGEFVYQKVKIYSSGMFVRLAFSVAISVDPDILIVDEALAVGDELFQRKCYGRIKELRQNGTTILFVSHGADTVVQLCDQVLLLDQGERLLFGDPKFVIAKYQKLLYAPPEKLNLLIQELRNSDEKNDFLTSKKIPQDLISHENGLSNKSQHNHAIKPFIDPEMISKSLQSYEPRGGLIKDVKITTLDGLRVNNLVRRQKYIFKYQVAFQSSSMQVRFGMMIKNITGIELGGASTSLSGKGIEFVKEGAIITASFRFCCLLQPGTYFINAGVMGLLNGCETILHRILDAVVFKVIRDENILATQLIDFQIESAVTLHKEMRI